MMKKKTLTPVLLGGIFFLMLGLSFAAVPLYDMFCRITGFGGTTQVSKEAPNIVLDKVVSVRFDTNVNINRKTINAKIATAVKIFFFLVFLSGIIIKFYLLKKEQISEISIKLNIQI